MRLLILSMLLANAALMSAIDPASAQSPTSYPWCSRLGDNTNVNKLLLHEQRAMRAHDFRNRRLLLPEPILSGIARWPRQAVNPRRSHHR